MKILIIHAHWNNRGDEAALRGMIDELYRKRPDCDITMQILSNSQITQFRDPDSKITLIPDFPKKKHMFEIPIFILSGGRCAISQEGVQFVKALKEADIVVHAPGGPIIGEIYRKAELKYLIRLLAAICRDKPVFFYAVSMGPFKNFWRNILRKFILNRSARIIVREGVSKNFINELGVKTPVTVTLDSAFQNMIDLKKNKTIFKTYKELGTFLGNTKKIIGLTVTDLRWNSKYDENQDIIIGIKRAFTDFIAYACAKGYKILFIPQLFGELNDYAFMSEFRINDNVYVMSDDYDCHFQQYVISRLRAVVGMRYHSNIFSAKMNTPFISISYEHKMRGFMEKAGLSDYCIDINSLNGEILIKKFSALEKNYSVYKSRLKKINRELTQESSKTTDELITLMDTIHHSLK